MKGENLKKNAALNGAANDCGRGGCSLGKGNAGGSSRRSGVFARAILVPLLVILVFTLVLLGFQTFDAPSGSDSTDLNSGTEPTAKAASGNWIDNCASSFNGGSGTAASPYEIASGAQLALMAKKIRDENSSYNSKYWKLVNNIDLSAHYWNVSIGVNGDDNKKFMGWFHGQGYTINGMTITTTDGNRDNVGLFGYIEGRGDRNSSDNRAAYFTVVESFTLTGSITTQTSGYKRCGGVVGYAYMMCCIKNIHAHVNITASGNTDEIGGICGHIEQMNNNGPTKVTVIQNCTSTGTISSSKNLTCTGGIAGYANTNNDYRGTCAINRCASYMKITSTGTSCGHIGGIVGHLRGGTSESADRRVLCTECYFAGTITIGNSSSPGNVCGVVGFYEKLRSASEWMSGNWMRTNSVRYNNGSGIYNRVCEAAKGSPDSNNADCLCAADGSIDFTQATVTRPYGPTWNISSGDSFTGGGYSEGVASWSTSTWRTALNCIPVPAESPLFIGLGQDYGAGYNEFYRMYTAANLNCFSVLCKYDVSGSNFAAHPWSGPDVRKANVFIMNNITLNYRWLPIENYSGLFMPYGYGDGQSPKYAITIKQVTKTSGGNIGFFANTNSGARVKGLIFRLDADWSVSGGGVGVICGTAYGSSFWWCRVTQSTTSSGHYIRNTSGQGTGGAIGAAYSCDIYDVDNGSVVSGTSSNERGIGVQSNNTSYAKLGGVVGVHFTSTSYTPPTNHPQIILCDNYGSVTANNTSSTTNATRVGGVAGAVGETSGTAAAVMSFAYCKNYGAVTYTGVKLTGDSAGVVGGVVGVFHGGYKGDTVHDLENYGNVNTTVSNVGGVIGLFGPAEGVTGFSLINEGSVKGANYVGGLVGWHDEQLTSTASTPLRNGASGKIDDGTVGAVTGEQYVGGISGQSENSITGGSEWTTVNYGKIVGSVEGSRNICGIVGWLMGASRTISYARNYGTVENQGTTAPWQTAGIAGKNDGDGTVIDHCYNSGDISATTAAAETGGIIGYVSATATISNCTNAADVTSGYGVGGIVGIAQAAATINNCHTESGCTITGSSARGNSTVDGLPGTATHAGGLVGGCSAAGMTIDGRCYNAANVTSSGNKYVGGIVGYTVSPLTKLFNRGNISGGKDYTGGIAGYTTNSISYCTNTGSVTGGDYTGGIVGETTANLGGFLSNVGTVSGKSYVGGIAGKASSTIEASKLYNGKWVSSCYTVSYGESIWTITTPSSSQNADFVFKYTVGSESGYDFFKILLGSDEKVSASGVVAETSYTITCAASQTITVKYYKDSGADSNGDFAEVLLVGGGAGRVSGSGSRVGGIVGYYTGNGTISGAENYGYITATSMAGGIVGSNESKTTYLSCINYGEIKATGADNTGNYTTDATGRAGGIVASITSSSSPGTIIAGCENYASVSGIRNCGGIVGYTGQAISIIGCSNSGDIVASYVVGGIIGDAQGTTSFSGPISNSGAVRATGSGKAYTDHGAGAYAGGIVGHFNSGTFASSSASSGSWTSPATADSNSSSTTFTPSANCIVDFTWSVSSENNYDWMTITVGSTEILKKSGEASGTLSYYVPASTTVTLKYTKDGSSSSGSDSTTISWTIAGSSYTNNGSAVKTDNLGGYWESTTHSASTNNNSITFTVKTAGTLNFHWTVSCEGKTGGTGWDYLKILKGSTSVLEKNPGNNLGGILTGDTSVSVAANDTITIYFYKDGGTDKGTDRATVNWGGGAVSNTGTGAYVGGIAGYWNPSSGFSGTISNAAGIYSAGDDVGGIAGQINAPIAAATNTGDVSGRSYVGGIAGVATRTIGNSSVSSYTYTVTNSGAISNTGRNVAGIVSYLTSNTGMGVYGAKNSGTVTGATTAYGSDSHDYWQTAGIVGKFDVNNTTIKYCYNTGAISSGYAENGGIVGYFSSTGNTIDHCVNEANVSGLSLVGGIVGLAGASSAGTISNCESRSGKTITATGTLGFTEGNVPSGANVGGILGATATTGSLTFGSGNNNYSTINGGTNNYVGGIAGYSSIAVGSSGKAVNNSGAVTGGSYVGGLVGYAGAGVTGINSCSSATIVSASGNYVGGCIGWANVALSLDASTYIRTNASGKTVSGAAGVGGLVGYANGAVSITAVTDGKNTNNANVTANSTAEIVSGWSGAYVGGVVGYCKGNFTGAGANSIHNSGAITGDSGAFVGGICGMAESNFTKAKNDGTVHGKYYVGGVAGWADGTFSDATNTKAVTAIDTTGTKYNNTYTGTYAGGLIGYAVNAISGTCTNTGAVTCSGPYAGGIAGWSNGTIGGTCTNSAAISGTYCVGGFAGFANNTITIGTGSNSGNVTATSSDSSGEGSYAGGIAGWAAAAISGNGTTSVNSGKVIGAARNVGGICGLAAGGTLNSLTNSGVVGDSDHKQSYTGGIAGECYTNVTIADSTLVKNTGAVTGANYTGGIVGYTVAAIGGGAAVTNTGAVTGGERTGGIVGETNGTGATIGAGGAVTNGASGSVDSTTVGYVYGGVYTGGIVGFYGGNIGANGNNIINYARVSGQNNVGGIGGRGSGSQIGKSDAASYTIQNQGQVISRDTATGNWNVGGIIGAGQVSTSIYHAKNTGKVTSNGVQATGGIAGHIKGGTISSCANEGDISGKVYTGGLCGQIESANVTITGCTQDSDVTGTYGVGGLVGGIYSGSAQSKTLTVGTTTVAGSVTATTSGTINGVAAASAGGILGIATYSWTVTVSHTTATLVSADVEGTGTGVGGVIGYVHNGSASITGKSGTATVTGNVTGSASYTGGIVGYMMANLTLDNVSYNTGTVSGTNDVGGLIGAMDDGALTISNTVQTAGGSVTGSSYNVGGCIGVIRSNADNTALANLSNSATVQGAYLVGGVIGSNQDADCALSSLSNGGTVTATSSGESGSLGCTGAIAGGIAGGSAGSVSGTNNSGGTVTGKGAYVGGVVGYAKKSAGGSNAASVSAVNGSTYYDYVGGIAGCCLSTVSGENSGSAITGKDCVGGVVGNAEDAVDGASSTAGTVTGSYWVGGVVGRAASTVGTTTAVYNGGTTVTGAVGVGGVIGLARGGNVGNGTTADSSASVRNTGTSNATVTGKRNVGGVIGLVYADSANATITGLYISDPYIRVTASDGHYGFSALIGTIYAAKDKTVTFKYAARGAGMTVQKTGGGDVTVATPSTDKDTSDGSYTTGIAGGIGGFVGVCTGEGNVTITDISDSYNVTGTNVSVTGSTYSVAKGGVGGIVGMSVTTGLLTIGDGSSDHKVAKTGGAVSGRTSNASSTTPSVHVGGLVGLAYYTEINGCSNAATVTGYQAVGGIVGTIKVGTSANSKITSCTNGNAITSRYTMVGGFVGRVGFSSSDTKTLEYVRHDEYRRRLGE